MASAPEIKVKSVKKAADVLNCFIDKQPIGVTEISEKLGLYKSNVHSILSTLAAVDYVTKDEATDKYYLGPGIVRLNRSIGNRFSLANVAAKYMRNLSAEEREVVYLTAPLKDQIFYIDVALPEETSYGHVSSVRNSMDYIHSTASGKGMLAYMPQSYVDNILSQPLPAMTESTITDPDELRRELDDIRKRGYSIDNMETSVGISCVAVPIISFDGTVKASISISGPSPRFSPERIVALAAKLTEIARKIAREM